MHSLVEALERLANDMSRPAEERSTAQKILAAIPSASREVGVAVLTNVLTRVVGA